MQKKMECSDTSSLTAMEQSLGEQIANAVSHGVGALAALIAAPVLIVSAVQKGSAWGIVGVSVFAVTTILLYLTSTLYHALPTCKAKQLFKILDHGAIFLLIAGTYTPFTLGVLRGTWGWTLFGLVWTLALFGIILKSLDGAKDSKASTVVYLVMGWLVVIAIKPMLMHVSAWGLFWLVSGGLAYSAGVIFFALDGKVKYAHFVWHLFVIAGTSCHFFAVLGHSS